jgi:8-oxo-dGTP diphosphatase
VNAGTKEAIVVVIERDERVLIIQRAPSVPGGGYWTPLSGRIEPGESQAEAVVRETREEVGLNVRPIRWVWECPTWDGKIRLNWWLAELVDGEIVIAPDEVSVARWMSVQEFLSLEKTFKDDRRFFMDVFPKCRANG